MRSLRILIALSILCASLLPLAIARPEYAKKEGKTCVFCHVKIGSKELTDAGKYYKDHNHSLEGYKAPEAK
jgi:hypothetical protein